MNAFIVHISQMIQKKHLFWLLFTAMILSVVFYFYKNSTSKIVRDALKNARLDSTVTEINFSKEIDKNIVKICIQTPYQPQDRFEMFEVSCQ